MAFTTHCRMERRVSQSMLSARMSASSTTSPRAFTNRHSITLSMRFSTSMSDAWSMAGMSPSAFAMRSSSLALAAQRREVRFSTWMRHMTSSSVPWNLFQPSFMCGPPFSSRGHPMPKASFKGCWPADGTRRDLQKGF